MSFMRKINASRGAREPSSDAAAQVVAYNDDGTIRAKLLGDYRFGEGVKGREFDIALNAKSDKAPSVAAFASGQGDSKMKTPVGGVLEFDRLRLDLDKGTGECSWISLLSKDPEAKPVTADVYTRVGPVMRRTENGFEPVKDEKGVNRYRVTMVDADNAERINNADFMLTSVRAAYEASANLPTSPFGRHVVVAFGDENDPKETSQIYIAPRVQKTESGEFVQESIEDAFERTVFPHLQDMRAALEDEGFVVEVMPAGSVQVGSATSQVLEKSADHSSRNVATSRFEMKGPKGTVTHGFAKANVVTGSANYEDGGKVEFATHVRPASGAPAVPLAFIATPALPAKFKGYEPEAAASQPPTEPEAANASPEAEAPKREEPSIDTFDDEIPF